MGNASKYATKDLSELTSTLSSGSVLPVDHRRNLEQADGTAVNVLYSPHGTYDADDGLTDPLPSGETDVVTP